MISITTAELRSAIDQVLTHIETHGSEIIEINDDFYWDVPQEARYDNYEKPMQLNVGQLSDDINEVKRLASGDMPAIGFSLVWISAVLRRIGETSPI